MTATEERASSSPVSIRDFSELVLTGPGTLAGRYLRLAWQPVCISDELPVGRPRPIRIMSEDFTLYRGESGAPQVVDFRCAHRGTQLSTAWVEGDAIRCRYHGWMYAASGQCVEQPGELTPFCQKIRIRSYPTQDYLGLVFAYFGEGEPPPLPRYPSFERDGVRLIDTYVRPCNFFNNFENDPIHSYITHHRTHDSWRDVTLPLIEVAETASGIATTRVPREGTLPEGRVLPEDTNLTSQFLFPNVSYRRLGSLAGAERGANLTFRIPIDDVSHRVYNLEWFAHGDRLKRYIERREKFLATQEHTVDELVELVFSGQMHLDDIPAEGADVHFVNLVEDAATQVGQGPIADRKAEHLGSTDVSVMLLREVWKREVLALTEGRPLKQWILPEDA
jgi:5,5'-dehydrodivanillate O-demethylase oxygenase subunit